MVSQNVHCTRVKVVITIVFISKIVSSSQTVSLIRIQKYFSCRLLCNYETNQGSFTFREDILNHILSEKNVLTSGDDIVTKWIWGKAINKLWSSTDAVGGSEILARRV